MSDDFDVPSAGQPGNRPGVAVDEDMPVPLLPRIWSALRGTGGTFGAGGPGRKWSRRVVGLAVLAAIIVVGINSFSRVRENEVGVLVDNVTGQLLLKKDAGYYVCFPYLSHMYVLDGLVQRLDLGWRQGPGGAGRDLKLKTSDGSNVSMDVVITFKLIPEKAVEVLRRSGPGLRFADTFVEPFARFICFSCFGQLTTEQMYDATRRNERAQAAVQALNNALGLYGIQVISVIPGEFRFYKEYEQVIQEKKLADQQVEEQQAQALAAIEDQNRELVEANKKAEARLAAFDGECTNRLIQARAEADRVRRDADAKFKSTTLSADAGLYAAEKQATSQKATMFAEADGLQRLRQAMVGDGGLSMVAMEYAKRLERIHFSATPIAREPSVHQFAVQPGEAAAVTAQPSASPTAQPPVRDAGARPAAPRAPAESPRPPVMPGQRGQGGAR